MMVKRKFTLGYIGVGNGSKNADEIYPFNSVFGANKTLVYDGVTDDVDAVVIWGGIDIHPSIYNQEPHPKNQTKGQATPNNRDIIEWHIMREAYAKRKMIIGVCRGAQMLCCFAGGSLYQDVHGHNTSHDLMTYDKKTLYALADHHQMMNVDGTKYELLAWPHDPVGDDDLIGYTAQISYGHYHREKEINEPGQHLEMQKEPEVVWFPEVRGFACQPHPEWTGQNSIGFVEWVNKEIEKRLFNVV